MSGSHFRLTVGELGSSPRMAKYLSVNLTRELPAEGRLSPAPGLAKQADLKAAGCKARHYARDAIR
jgi:hypothetical protein